MNNSRPKYNLFTLCVQPCTSIMHHFIAQNGDECTLNASVIVFRPFPADYLNGIHCIKYNDRYLQGKMVKRKQK